MLAKSLLCIVALASSALAVPAPEQTFQLAARQGYDPDCTSTYSVERGDTCDEIRDKFNGTFTTPEFFEWNPQVNANCSNLLPGEIVCVGVGETGPIPPCPVPVKPGLVSNCDACYKIVSGDYCDLVASKNGIPASDLYLWNPDLTSSCSNLEIGYNYCVGVSD
ncbi:hypothetical protein F5Y15DRAFT_420562 [Xylariaceae sp. FL0016]|nr:hypothetical protein F5Y15DRAFT_420562 [Xylariaceae sp. FL0016]